MSKIVGFKAENKAREYLIKQGLHWHESNYQCPFGEVDLIMQDHLNLIFVEVRLRTSSSFGGALASVTYSKQQKIIKTANHYLMAKKIRERFPVRFDILAFDGKDLEIQWIKNAFGLNF